MSTERTSKSIVSTEQDVPEHRPLPYVIGAVAILAAAIVVEALRFVWPWPNVPVDYHSYLVSSGVMAVSALAIPALLMRRLSGRLAVAAWTFSFAAPVALFLHGMMTRIVANSYLGFLYVPAAAILAFCLKRVWDGSELARTRRMARREREEDRSSESDGGPVSAPAH